jgi:dinuclear metal center YbgI/SA1388 family protein
MIKCGDVMDYIEQLAPAELAEEWDNTGLLLGGTQHGVSRIMVCLDVTYEALAAAVSQNVDLIVTHHPVIFKGIKRISEDDAKGKQLYTAVSNGICVISAHTNLDHADCGVNARLAETLGLENTVLLGKGPGRMGSLKERMSFDDFVAHVKQRLDVPFVRTVGSAVSGISKVAVFSGSFDNDLEALQASDADAVVTGDLKYHTALDAREAGLCLIDAGHFGTERVILPYLAAALAKRFPETEVIRFSQEKDPFITC